MLHASLPWPKKVTSDPVVQIYKANISYDRHLSDEAKDFLKKCLAIEEAKRLSVSEMENHPFITKVLGNGLYLEECTSPLPLVKIKSGKLK